MNKRDKAHIVMRGGRWTVLHDVGRMYDIRRAYAATIAAVSFCIEANARITKREIIRTYQD